MKKELEISGRKSGKRIAQLIEFDENIRQGNFPILVHIKPKDAVVISLEEYKKLMAIYNHIVKEEELL